MAIEWLTELIPDENTSEERRKRWRKRISWTCLFAAVSLLVLVPALTDMLFTGASPLGRVAWASDIDKAVDTKLAPIQQRIVSIDEKLREQSTATAELVAASLTPKICKLEQRRQKETDDSERQELAKTLRGLRDRYKHYAGEEFDFKDC